MEPYARAGSADVALDKQVWGDAARGILLVLDVPAGRIVDLTPDGVGIDIAGPGIVLSHVPNHPLTIETVLEMESEGHLDWGPIRYYSVPSLPDSSLGPEPKKSVTISPDPKGRFYRFLSDNATPGLMDSYADLLMARGFVKSAVRSRAGAVALRILVFCLLLATLASLILSGINRATR